MLKWDDEGDVYCLLVSPSRVIVRSRYWTYDLLTLVGDHLDASFWAFTPKPLQLSVVVQTTHCSRSGPLGQTIDGVALVYSDKENKP